MAREAGIEFDLIDEDEGQICYITSEGLERFAALVEAASAAAENEACAVTADKHMQECEGKSFGVGKAIRARGTIDK